MASMDNIMYQDTLMNLYAGVVSAIDREVLSYSPLPSNIVDPYASHDVDPANIMNLTYSAMVVWIDEAKKADYFSKHFVTLSRMIMSGTQTMARGLVTIHGRREDLSSAPMSIGDLISLSSYHFRKSYLGVIQTAKTRPEISERLLLNQLGWCNTLMRLYKTKEKLEKPVAAVPQGTETQLPENHQENPAIEETKTAGQLNEGPKSAALPMSSVKADQGIFALREPGSFTAPGAYNVIRAFTSFDHHDSAAKKASRVLNAAGDKKESSAALDSSKKSENDETLMSGNEYGLPETVRSEKTDREQENKPGDKEKNETEVRIFGKEEEIQKNNIGTKEPVTDFPKTENQETVPNLPKSVIDVQDSEHVGAVSNVPAEDDLNEDEKKILLNARSDPDYLDQMRMNLAEPDFWTLLPDLAVSFQKVLAVIDST